MELNISLLLKAIYFLIAATLIVKILRLLAIYAYKFYVYKNVPGLPITLPLIGNLHYLKDRKGWFEISNKEQQKKQKSYSLNYFLDLLQVIIGFSRDLKQFPIWRIWLG